MLPNYYGQDKHALRMKLLLTAKEFVNVGVNFEEIDNQLCVAQVDALKCSPVVFEFAVL
ncbi:MAG: hypothetical protein RM347_021730 [Nostoc sp. ChiQUE02]|uniref:hypothetical protein n=1 Tax=Nostoc sp. ChiQUE02 TaxID=3075377 RepID=UPI002AD2CBB1|nr:hypothetical protein [Nostoc sp. ChiQUE02]MDZ8228627.1 hypothetical protein [Nostoc sp. ChiQUE02]